MIKVKQNCIFKIKLGNLKKIIKKFEAKEGIFERQKKSCSSLLLSYLVSHFKLYIILLS